MDIIDDVVAKPNCGERYDIDDSYDNIFPIGF